MRVSAQRSSQRSRYACACSRLSKRSPLSGVFCAWPTPDSTLPFRSGSLHAARQRDRAVMLQHVAVERIERGIVDIGREHAFAQIIQHDHARHAAQSAKRFLVQFRPDSRAGSEHQQANRFPAVAERQHEQPRAPVLAALRIAHHGAGAVIDLRLFARRGLDHHASFRSRRSAQLAYEPLDALISRR